MAQTKSVAVQTEAPTPQKKSLIGTMANKYSVEPSRLLPVLKDTCFKGATDEQMVALLVVANEYNLNPFTKEIYAFPAKGGGIVPVVGIDGWLRIINEHPQFDGMEIENDGDSCTCKIYRKDRTHPTIITEYLSECIRSTDPWKACPSRMLRHKTIIQCARVAFSFTGIKDEDDAQIITDAEVVGSRPLPKMPMAKIEAPKQEERQPGEDEELNLTPEQKAFADETK